VYYVYNYYLDFMTQQQQLSSPEQQRIADEYSRQMISIIDGDSTQPNVSKEAQAPAPASSSSASGISATIAASIPSQKIQFTHDMSPILYLVLSNLLSSTLFSCGSSSMPHFFRALTETGIKSSFTILCICGLLVLSLREYSPVTFILSFRNSDNRAEI